MVVQKNQQKKYFSAMGQYTVDNHECASKYREFFRFNKSGELFSAIYSGSLVH